MSKQRLTKKTVRTSTRFSRGALRQAYGAATIGQESPQAATTTGATLNQFLGGWEYEPTAIYLVTPSEIVRLPDEI